MIGHLAKIFTTMVYTYISRWVETKGLRPKGHANFKRNHHTSDHIFTLNFIIEEAKAKKYKVYCCFVNFFKGIVPQYFLIYRVKVEVLQPWWRSFC
jgi:hypothetical protein